MNSRSLPATTLLILSFLTLIQAHKSQAQENNETNPLYRIGIIQHFGSKANDSLVLKASPSSPLKINWYESFAPDATPTQLTLNELALQATDLTGQEAQSTEVIAGYYRTYETAHGACEKLSQLSSQCSWEAAYQKTWRVRCRLTSPQEQNLAQNLVNKLLAFGYKQATIQDLPSRGSRRFIGQSGQGLLPVKAGALLAVESDSSISVNGVPYKGVLYLLPDTFGNFTLIDELRLEEYLRGVVPHEIGAKVPLAAIQAQAVLARTYALANRDRFLGEGYNLCASQHCQVYKGEAYNSPIIDTGILSTRGQVLLDGGGKVASIFYYSTDGGHSANFEDVWGTSSRFQSKSEACFTCSQLPAKFDLRDEKQLKTFLTSPESKTWGCFDAASPLFRWHTETSLASLSKTMSKAREKWAYDWPAFQNIEALQVSKRSPSGRVIELTVRHDRDQQFKVHLDDVRAALGGLKSNFFLIEEQQPIKAASGKGIVIYGAGFGHGVGLSQYGARQLAERGIDYKSILNTYFPALRLASLPEVY